MNDENRNSIFPFDVKKIPWKLIFSLLAVVGVGGGGSYVFMTGDQVEECVDRKAVEIEKHVESTYVKIDPTFNEVKNTINQVQTVQHAQISRDEARRITAPIDDREIREASYDRLVGMSMRRMKMKKEPCLNIDCSN